jgi:hypothetical protein
MALGYPTKLTFYPKIVRDLGIFPDVSQEKLSFPF